MDVIKAINERRAYRSLRYLEVTDTLVRDLAEAARLAPSCFNNQPWRYIFVYEPDKLKELHTALSPGNLWAHNGSLIIVVMSNKGSDCVIKGREYYLFDTGLATGFIILRAQELGLVTHPIAGYNQTRVKEVLGIPADLTVITLLIIGRRSEELDPSLSEGQMETEKKRPERLPLKRFVHLNRFKTEDGGGEETP